MLAAPVRYSPSVEVITSDEEDSPFQRVGVIKVAPQDSWDAQRVEAVNEKMRFSVWTGLAAHQPLGNINCARKSTYRHSARFRETFNNCPIREPSTHVDPG